MWAARYLIKSAALYNPAHPDLNYRLAELSARRQGHPVFSTGDPRLGGYAKKTMPKMEAYGLFKPPPAQFPHLGGTIYLDPVRHPRAFAVPSFGGEVLRHELSEAQASRRDPRAIFTNAPSRKLTGSPQAVEKQLARAGFMHASPTVVLQDSNRIAAGEVGPEAARRLIQDAKRTGEYQAMHRAGVPYGKRVVPEGGRAWQRFHERAARVFPTLQTTTGPVTTVPASRSRGGMLGRALQFLLGSR